jgi:uncharacterized protein YndB with AHSA1/START domain
VTKRSAQHATFVIERDFDATPAQVFAAWATREAKARWFVGPDGWKTKIRELDFRVGGRERLVGARPDGKVSDFSSHYEDIVANERIIYTYDMRIDDARISVSLATVEFRTAGRGMRLTVTEQGVFLDGYDDAGSRERGTRVLLDKLETAVRHAPASA